MISEPARVILVVDDNPAHVAECERALKDAGYIVLTAPSGAAALQILQLMAVHLVLVDVSMPENDGIEVLQYVRRRPLRSAVVAMSGADHSRDLLDLCGTFGARAILAKPFTVAELTTTVAEVLRKPWP